MADTDTKRRFTIRLSDETAQLLQNASGGRYGAVSAIADQAIRQWFHPASDERFSIMARRIDQMQNATQRMAEDQIVTMQAINSFVWFFMLMTPTHAQSMTKPNKALALKRYQEWLTRLGRDVRGDTLLSDLVLEEDAKIDGNSGATNPTIPTNSVEMEAIK